MRKKGSAKPAYARQPDAYIEERVLNAACYIAENGATVRETAKVLSVSKSTVHKDVSERLRMLNPALFCDVRRVLDINKAERHIRGGRATCRKYSKLALK